LVCEKSYLVPKNAIIRYQPESNISECVRLYDAHMAYTNGPGWGACM